MNGVVAHRAPATLLQRVRWDVLGARKLQAVHPISNCVNNIGFMEDVRRAHAAVQAAGEARASASAPPSEAMMAEAVEGALRKALRHTRKQGPLSDAALEALTQRIAHGVRRRVERPTWMCPACAVVLTTSSSLTGHVARCCPDAFDLPALQAAAKQQQQLQKDEETRYRQQQRELHEHHRQQMQLQQQECSQQAEAAHAVGMDCAHAEPEVAEGEAASPCPDLLAPLVGAATMREAALRAQALDIAFLHGKVEAADEGEEDADAEAGQPGSKRLCMASATGTKTPQARRADARTADATAAAAAVGGATLVEEAAPAAAAASTPVEFADSEAKIQDAARRVGEALRLPFPRAQRLLRCAMRAIPLPADPEPLEVVAEDEHFLAVAKPAGVHTAPVHRWKGGSMVNRALGHLGGTSPYVLHRLDQDTSGLLLFAKHVEVVAPVHEQFRSRTMRKVYLAIVVGCPAPEGIQGGSFTVDAPIGMHPTIQEARAIGGMDAKPANTDFHILATVPDVDLASTPGCTEGETFDPAARTNLRGASLMACTPHSGRTHQIRLHLAHVGHPIVGDELYGVSGPWIGRQALHAARLGFTHPLTGQAVCYEAPLPEDFQAALAALGLPQHTALGD